MDSQLPFPALLYRTKIIPERHNPNTKPPSLFLYRHKDSLSSTAPLPPENGTGQPCRPARSPYRPDGKPVIFSRKSRSPTIPEPPAPAYRYPAPERKHSTYRTPGYPAPPYPQSPGGPPRRTPLPPLPHPAHRPLYRVRRRPDSERAANPRQAQPVPGRSAR